MCRSEIEPCYEHRAGELGCVNPEFKELPAGSPTFRVIARLPVAAGTRRSASTPSRGQSAATANATRQDVAPTSAAKAGVRGRRR